MSGTKVALKIIGILVGIIAVCVVLALVIGVPVLKNMKYNNAQKLAEAGNYTVAISELSGRDMDEYKDVKVKKQEYAIAAAKQYIAEKDKNNALSVLDYAIKLNADKELTKEAKKLFDKTKQ